VNLLEQLAKRMEELRTTRVEQFAFLGLGSNVGDRLDLLQRAVELIHADDRTRVDAVSSVYETAAVGGPEQPDYLNIAVRVATRRQPRQLLALGAEIENALGRTRDVRWGPRTIDIDILLYDRRIIRQPDLEIPHPRLRERAFALIPLIEVAPGQTMPDGTSLPALLAKLAPVEGMTVIGTQVRQPTLEPPPQAAPR